MLWGALVGKQYGEDYASMFSARKTLRALPWDTSAGWRAGVLQGVCRDPLQGQNLTQVEGCFDGDSKKPSDAVPWALSLVI